MKKFVWIIPMCILLLACSKKEGQNIDFKKILEQSFSNETFILEASASSGLPVNFASSDPSIVSVSGNIAYMHKVGKTTITASQEGNEAYNSAQEVQQVVSVIKDIKDDLLVKSMTCSNGEFKHFEYDYQNRIVKIEGMRKYNDENGSVVETFTAILIYNEAGDLIRSENSISTNGKEKEEIVVYEKRNDRILVFIQAEGGWIQNIGLIIDQEERYIGMVNEVLLFDNGNLIFKKYHTSEIQYSYDNKRSPFSSCKTPKWYLYLACNQLYSDNNCIKEKLTYFAEERVVINTNEYTYEFNEDDYPIKELNKNRGFDYIYIKKNN